jgi:hypothetical protein
MGWTQFPHNIFVTVFASAVGLCLDAGGATMICLGCAWVIGVGQEGIEVVDAEK